VQCNACGSANPPGKKFCGECGAALPGMECRPIAPAAPVNVPRDAERRQLTVMFCDLVGSTALAGRLDPEELRSLIGRYHEAVAAAVAPYAGHVAQFLGDGVLVYFGYPSAHEDTR
jgi:class 3 adenylate cyclase